MASKCSTSSWAEGAGGTYGDHDRACGRNARHACEVLNCQIGNRALREAAGESATEGEEGTALTGLEEMHDTPAESLTDALVAASDGDNLEEATPRAARSARIGPLVNEPVNRPLGGDDADVDSTADDFAEDEATKDLR